MHHQDVQWQLRLLPVDVIHVHVRVVHFLNVQALLIFYISSLLCPLPSHFPFTLIVLHIVTSTPFLNYPHRSF